MTKICDRCGQDIDKRYGKKYKQLYTYTFEDEFGEKVKKKLCWDCEWDVMNGGDPFEDSVDIYFRCWEEDYEYDPINTPPPPGYGGY